MPDVACKSQAALRPLDPGLGGEVQDWVRELRVIWAATGLSMNQFACLYPIDKGTLSRYLNGQRVPRDHWFLDKLLAIQADNGKPVVPAVRQHLEALQLRALQTAHPHEYRVRMINDELEIAVTTQREAERYAHALEAQLAGLHRQVQDLTSDKNRLRSAWDADRTAMQAEHQRLTREIRDLTKQLHLARERAAQAEQRCHVLEDLADHLNSSPPPDVGIPEVDVPIAALRRASTFSLEDLVDVDAVTCLLQNFAMEHMTSDATMLAEWAAAHAPIKDPKKLTRLLFMMRWEGFREQGRSLARRAANQMRQQDLEKAATADQNRLLLAFFGVCADDATKMLARRLIPLYRVEHHDWPQVRETIRMWWTVGAKDEVRQLVRDTTHLQAARYAKRLEGTKAPDRRSLKARLIRSDRHTHAADPDYELVIDKDLSA